MTGLRFWAVEFLFFVATSWTSPWLAVLSEHVFVFELLLLITSEIVATAMPMRFFLLFAILPVDICWWMSGMDFFLASKSCLFMLSFPSRPVKLSSFDDILVSSLLGILVAPCSFLSSHIREARSKIMGGFGSISTSFSDGVMTFGCDDDSDGDCGNGTKEEARRIDIAIKYGRITGIAIASMPNTPRRLCLVCRRSCESLNCSVSDTSSNDTRFDGCDRSR